MYLDGRKDSTLTTLVADNGKRYQGRVLEEHYVVVGEPGSYYLTHFTPKDSKASSIAEALFENLDGTELKNKLKIVGSDGTATMTGPHGGCIRRLEVLLGRSVQWCICLLHLNELPLRHVFVLLDGNTRGPSCFDGPIGRNLTSTVSDWPVAEFTPIPCNDFPRLSSEVEQDLSTDQLYAYKLAVAVQQGVVDDDLRLLEVGPGVHSRWLTLACRILRFYVSLRRPSEKLVILTKFCMLVYLPSFFQIKSNHKFTNGAPNFFSIMKRTLSFSNDEVKRTALDVLKRNAFFAHPENTLVAMLGHEETRIRKIGVDRVLTLKDKVTKSNKEVRKFTMPTLNCDANEFFEMSDLKSDHVCIPLLLKDYSKIEIEQFVNSPLEVNHPCHNQTVERHVKLVTEASSMVSTFERRDGLIRQRISSRRLMKKFDSKNQFDI